VWHLGFGTAWSGLVLVASVARRRSLAWVTRGSVGSLGLLGAGLVRAQAAARVGRRGSRSGTARRPTGREGRKRE
jgi:hypothetical protein